MKHKTVLIADDEPNILSLIEQTLEKLVDDYDVELITAQNGRDALEIIQHRHPDLVFLDVMMPQMSGLEVCNIVKQQLYLQNIYIIMLTAKGQEFERQSGFAVGADLYMTKPFIPKEILNKSLEVLGLN
jgi:CheY-like chemotaxis protein